MTVRIVGATLRDLTYIACNLRPDDHAEADCQFDTSNANLIAIAALQGPSYVVELRGNPEAAFGAVQHRKGLWTAWSWGTPRMARCVPAITAFVRDELISDLVDQGAHRVEARALASNAMALRWLRRLGANERCLLPAYGKNGEDFVLFDWTRDHVLQQQRPQTNASPARPGD